MSITTRRLAAACVAACLSAGLTLAPAASAADGGTKAAAAQKKKKSKAPSTKKLKSDLTKVRTRTTKAERDLRQLRATLEALDTLAKGTEGKANALTAAAPQLITGLTQLGNAVQNQIAPGLKTLSEAVQGTIAPNLTKLGAAVNDQIVPNLTKLSDVVQKDIAPNLTKLGAAVNDEIVPNLTTLGDAVQNQIKPGLAALQGNVTTLGTAVGGLSATVPANLAEARATEFGVVRVYKVRGTDTTALGTVWTSDIPDDGNNAAQASGSVVDTDCQDGDVFVARGAIRSSEVESGVVGQGGASLIVTSGAGAFVTAEQTAVNAAHDGVRVVDIATASAKNTNDPTASGAGGETLVTTPDVTGSPAGDVCIVQGTAQFFDFGDAAGGTD